jgi:predicted RNA binding protein YcfA (HicA-like mRNA interferase family)
LPRLPIVSGREVIKALQEFGFKPVRQRGSHMMMRHEDGRGTTVPMHPELDRGTLNAIIKQTGVDRDEFLEEL